MSRFWITIAFLLLPQLAVANQTASPPLNADLAFVVQWQGAPAWDAYQQTASYKAFFESGLIPTLWEHTNRMLTQAKLAADWEETFTPRMSAIGSQIATVLWTHGMTLGMGFQATPDGDAPYVILVIPNGAPYYAAIRELAEAELDQGSFSESIISDRTVFRTDRAIEEASAAIWVEGSDLALFYGFTLISTDKPAAPSIEQLLQTPAAEQLSAQTHWQAAWQGNPETVDFLRIWCNIEHVFAVIDRANLVDPEIMTEPQFQSILNALGMNDWQAWSLRLGSHGQHVVQQWYLQSDTAPLQCIGWGDHTVALTQLPPLPADVTSFSLQTVDLARFQQQLPGLISQLQQTVSGLDEPRISDDALNLAEHTDFKHFLALSNPILSQLEPVLCLYHDGRQQLLPGIVPTLAIRIRNTDALVAALDNLGWTRDDRWGCPTYHQFNQLLPSSLTTWLSSSEFETAATAELRTITADQSILLYLGTSTIAVCDGWLVWGIQPQYVHAFALRSQGKLPRWSAQSIPADIRQQIPAAFTQLRYRDSRAEVELLTKLGPWAGDCLRMLTHIIASETPAASQKAAEPGQTAPLPADAINPPPDISPLAMPPVELVTHELHPTISVLTINDHGTRSCTYGSAFVRLQLWHVYIARFLAIALDLYPSDSQSMMESPPADHLSSPPEIEVRILPRRN